ncbi:hypothetical protein [Marinoscillum sp.]|uniref:hypothetical protein n=1 Tax=Marinoscillum sp. TaxID=2024838 RepID=UPI003BAA8D33
MKNLLKSSFILLAVASMTFLASCGDDDTEEPLPDLPSLTLSGELSSQTSFEVGDSVAVAVTFATPGELSGFNYQVTVNKDSADESVQTKVFQGPTDIGYTDTDVSGGFNFIFSSALSEELGGKTVTIDFEVVDKQDQLGTASWTFEVTYNPIVTHEQTLLGGQLNPDEESFYNAVDNMTYGYASFRDENSASTDFLFFYGNTNGYTISAVDDADANTAFSSAIDGTDDALGASIIETRNETRFVTTALSPEEFDAISNESALLDAYGDVSASSTKVNQLATDAVFAFELAEGRSSKKGLVKVVSTGGTAGADRTITILVKIQE